MVEGIIRSDLVTFILQWRAGRGRPVRGGGRWTTAGGWIRPAAAGSAPRPNREAGQAAGQGRIEPAAERRPAPGGPRDLLAHRAAVQQMARDLPALLASRLGPDKTLDDRRRGMAGPAGLGPQMRLGGPHGSPPRPFLRPATATSIALSSTALSRSAATLRRVLRSIARRSEARFSAPTIARWKVPSR